MKQPTRSELIDSLSNLSSLKWSVLSLNKRSSGWAGILESGKKTQITHINQNVIFEKWVAFVSCGHCSTTDAHKAQSNQEQDFETNVPSAQCERQAFFFL